MSTVATTVPKGRTFIRSLIARSVSACSSVEGMARFTSARWGNYQGDLVSKAAVSAITQNEVGEYAAQEFFGLVMERSLLRRMSGFRRIPFRTNMLKVVNGAIGYWTAESKPVPVSKQSLVGSTIHPLKVNCIICVTEEAINTAGDITEAGLQTDMERAVVDSLDLALLDATNAGVVDERPASITYGAPSIAASADAAADVTDLINLFDGDLGAAYFVTDSATATNMAMLRNASGALVFPDVGARGGSVIGIPLLISRASPVDSSGGQLALIDPTGIAYAADPIAVDKAQHATIAMSDDPESDPEQVSLWQTNTVAFKSSLPANWEVQRTGGVAYLSGAGW
ncbi:phage major capsid protein [Pseudomonas sp. EL_65y_Pfl2_R95]|uniref:phage major capsid protein n=1 Tax=Pseudomonas sp. EL_65y_Pfl2_R95 TaxID=3088698 RepID=UPI0030DD78DB